VGGLETTPPQDVEGMSFPGGGRKYLFYCVQTQGTCRGTPPEVALGYLHQVLWEVSGKNTPSTPPRPSRIRSPARPAHGIPNDWLVQTLHKWLLSPHTYCNEVLIYQALLPRSSLRLGHLTFMTIRPS
jgi:hypothetical protein